MTSRTNVQGKPRRVLQLLSFEEIAGCAYKSRTRNLGLVVTCVSPDKAHVLRRFLEAKGDLSAEVSSPSGDGPAHQLALARLESGQLDVLVTLGGLAGDTLPERASAVLQAEASLALN